MDKKSIIELTIATLVVTGGAFAFAYQNWYAPSISPQYVNIKTDVVISSRLEASVFLNATLNVINNSKKSIKIQAAWLNVHGEKIVANKKLKSFNDLVLKSFKEKTKNGVNKYYDSKSDGLIYSGRYEDDEAWNLEAGENVVFSKLVVVPTAYDVVLIRSELLFTEQDVDMDMSWKMTSNLVHPVLESDTGVNYKMSETRATIGSPQKN